MAIPMEKAFLDPVHGFILVDDEWLLQLIDTAEFQRLRRVRQLGASFGTYHGAEHTRFGHSLGAMHIMERILMRLQHVHGPLDEETRIVARAAALLHDVGHGPLSHSLEYLLTPDVGHEYWTKRIILEDTEVNRVLRSVDNSLPVKVAAVIDRRSQPAWVSDLVSSQLDVDRMDYLLRDALFTGAEYGRFQLDRVVNTLVVHEGQVAVRQKGLQAIEEYVLARHFMYWRVYLHKTIRGMELLLRAAVRRARQLVEGEAGTAIASVTHGPLGAFFRGGADIGPQQYLDNDDADLFVALKQWARSDDGMLADLSGRFLRRRLLKPVFSVPIAGLTADLGQVARDVVRRAGYDPDYYCLVDNTANVPYDTYMHSQPGTPKQPIVVRDQTGRLIEISRLSPLISGLAELRVRAVNVYVPSECRAAVQDAASADDTLN